MSRGGSAFFASDDEDTTDEEVESHKQKIVYEHLGDVIIPAENESGESTALFRALVDFRFLVALLSPAAQHSLDDRYPESYQTLEASTERGIVGFIESECAGTVSDSDLFLLSMVPVLAHKYNHPVLVQLTKLIFLCLLDIYPQLREAILDDAEESGGDESRELVEIFLKCVSVQWENLRYSGFTPDNASAYVGEIVENLQGWYLSRNVKALVVNSTRTRRISQRNTPCSISSTEKKNLPLDRH